MARSIIDPYVNEVRMDVPFMKRVEFANAEIGSRKSAMPKVSSNYGTIRHVGDGVGGK